MKFPIPEQQVLEIEHNFENKNVMLQNISLKFNFNIIFDLQM
jgi:hypothetical protein